LTFNVRVEAPIKLTTSGPIGAAKLMKVMAGDRIHTAVDYYFTTEEGDNSNANPLNTVVSSIVASITNSVGMGIFADHTSTVSSQLQGNSSLSNLVNTAANIPPQNIFGPPYAPQAFLCVLFFDERFQFDAASSYIEMVAWGANSKKTIDRTFGNALTAGKNGYVYVYFANESNTNVYFDNFYLSHERGPVLEETHYYPFGLTMAGISTKALGFGEPENKRNKFQAQEFNDDLGAYMYEFKYRMHDPQTGRFWQVDPLSQKYLYNSTYAFSENKVTSHIELEGLEAVPTEDKRPWPARVEGTPTQAFSVTSPFISTAVNMVVAHNVRIDYIEKAANLAKDDKTGRANLKAEARKNTPEPYRSIIEKGRPIEKEFAKAADPLFAGNATKTNVEVNLASATGRAIGNGLLILGAVESGITIATSPTPLKEAVTEGAGWGGAYLVGSSFATAAAPAGPYVSFAAGVIGSGVGFVAGKRGGDAVMNALPNAIEKTIERCNCDPSMGLY
jgi:RHS repeat-associated protein